MERAEVLDTAKNCVCGKREQDYGRAEDNFGIIAELWNVYLKGIGRRELGGRDVAHMMCYLKLGRITTGTATDDSYVDLAGYAACAAELGGKHD